ncbi:methyltransferase [Endozoicomonas sp. 4G]|uniref:methyltransferase n=1 Tax=Endozoicomonas sp. 4G TaxID=2872754 RepID=UPI0020788548|nr:methyltransferase [Endozoicomonas sp. 4G]
MINAEHLPLILTLCAGTLITTTIVFWSLRLGITPTPTSGKVRAKLLETLPAKVDGNIYELGSGFGSLVAVLAKTYPDQVIYGIERSPLPCWISRLRCLHLKNAVILQQDFFQHEWEEAGLVVCYLYPGAMETLSKVFKLKLKKGCYIVSHTFRLPGWEPESINKAKDLYRSPVYRYRCP